MAKASRCSAMFMPRRGSSAQACLPAGGEDCGAGCSTEQLDLPKSLDRDQYQGYCFSPAFPAADCAGSGSRRRADLTQASLRAERRSASSGCALERE
jgi:hypothetical protein